VARGEDFAGELGLDSSFPVFYLSMLAMRTSSSPTPSLVLLSGGGDRWGGNNEDNVPLNRTRIKDKLAQPKNGTYYVI
jgi:hypothetical protein